MQTELLISIYILSTRFLTDFWAVTYMFYSAFLHLIYNLSTSGIPLSLPIIPSFNLGLRDILANFV